MVEILPVHGLPEIGAGDDLAAALARALDEGPGLCSGDVLVVSSKLVSKASGLRDHRPDRRDVVADQTIRVVAERATGDPSDPSDSGASSGAGVTRIVEALAGPVMAAAGVDSSNTGPAGGHLVLPADPDAAARELLEELLDRAGLPGGAPVGLVLSDTAGRPWRTGVTDFALGAAGVVVIDDLRGEQDHDGRPLSVTLRAVGDELAAAADLVKGKATGVGAALLRGTGAACGLAVGFAQDQPPAGARSLVRTGPGDWFRTGDREAVRAALGIPAGSSASLAVGVAPTAPEERIATVVRAVRTALHTLPEEIGDLADGIGVDLGGEEVVVTAADAYLLGLAAARVCIALRGERIDAAAPERTGDQSVRITLT